MLAFLTFVCNAMYVESIYRTAIVMLSNNIVLSGNWELLLMVGHEQHDSDVIVCVFVFCVFLVFVLYLYCISGGNWELLLMVGARAVRR